MKAIATQNDTIPTYVPKRPQRRQTGIAEPGKVDDFTAIRRAIADERLIENEDFEWTRPLSLPGLLVAGRVDPAPAPAAGMVLAPGDG